MEDYAIVFLVFLGLSSICGFFCSLSLLILLFRIPNVSATDSRDEPDKEGESPPDRANTGLELDCNVFALSGGASRDHDPMEPHTDKTARSDHLCFLSGF